MYLGRLATLQLQKRSWVWHGRDKGGLLALQPPLPILPFDLQRPIHGYWSGYLDLCLSIHGPFWLHLNCAVANKLHKNHLVPLTPDLCRLTALAANYLRARYPSNKKADLKQDPKNTKPRLPSAVSLNWFDLCSSRRPRQRPRGTRRFGLQPPDNDESTTSSHLTTQLARNTAYSATGTPKIH